MKSLGTYMAVGGLISCVLNLIGYNLRLLMWIDLWGEGIGWAIRVGLIVGGAALFVLGARNEEPEAATASDSGNVPPAGTT